jgi:hypothetical protein
MSHPFLHPSSGMLLERVARLFRDEAAYLVPDRSLLFVCGGPVGPSVHSVRKQFLDYAATALPNFRIFLAEAAAKDITEYDEPKFLNLAQFEELISTFADCILLFAESAGSLAEIGFFAAHIGTRKKLLVVNRLEVQAAESFINNGPLALINDDSAFKPVIYLDFDHDKLDFSPINQRLLRYGFPAKKRQRFVFNTYSELQPRARLGIVLEIIKIFEPISLLGLQYIIKIIFDHPDYDEIRHLVSLALAVGYITRVGEFEDAFSVTEHTETLFVLNQGETERIRWSVLDFYKRNYSHIYSLERAPG